MITPVKLQAESIIKPLRPSLAWQQWPVGGQLQNMGYPVERWFHPRTFIQAFSAVEVAVDKDGSSNGPEYHISISKLTRASVTRVTSAEAAWVLLEFGLIGAEEDNHVPHGLVRNFWRPVADPLVGRECPCKADEPEIREDKGDFVWRP